MASRVKHHFAAYTSSGPKCLKTLCDGFNVARFRPCRWEDPAFLRPCTAGCEHLGHSVGHGHKAPGLLGLSVWIPDLLTGKVQVLHPQSEDFRRPHPSILGNDKHVMNMLSHPRVALIDDWSGETIEQSLLRSEEH